MVEWTFLLTAGAAGCFILSTMAVIADYENAFYVLFLLGLLLIILQAVALLAALFTRQWGHSLGILVGIVASLAVGLLCTILVAVGQHHPPHPAAEDIPLEEDSLIEVVTDSVPQV